MEARKAREEAAAKAAAKKESDSCDIDLFAVGSGIGDIMSRFLKQKLDESKLA